RPAPQRRLADDAPALVRAGRRPPGPRHHAADRRLRIRRPGPDADPGADPAGPLTCFAGTTAVSPKPPRLTAKLIQEIATRVHGGAFEQVAVESQGVPFAVYQEWLRRGRRKGSRGLVRQLALRVMQAKAAARVVPETTMRED